MRGVCRDIIRRNITIRHHSNFFSFYHFHLSAHCILSHLSSPTTTASNSHTTFPSLVEHQPHHYLSFFSNHLLSFLQRKRILPPPQHFIRSTVRFYFLPTYTKWYNFFFIQYCIAVVLQTYKDVHHPSLYPLFLLNTF